MGDLLRPVYVGDTELPYPEGTPGGPDVRPKEVDPVGRKATWTMTGMAASHQFLVPAFLQAAGLATDPVALYWAEHGLPKAEAPYYIDLGWDAFRGLPEPENRLIWACPKPHARGLVAYLARVQFGVGGTVAWEALHQRIPLVDRHLLLSLTTQPPTVPTVPVDVFGLTGPGGMYFWQKPTDPWTQGLRLVHQLPTDPNRKKRRPFHTTS